MALTAAATFAAACVDSLVAVGAFLLLGGMAAASNTAAGGRLVVGWFPPERRGLVMGIRHTASPLGVAAAALVIPHLGHHYGVAAALLFPAVLCALSAVASALGVINPHRPPHAEASPAQLANPYRDSKVLWRIHSASMLLMVPQSRVSGTGTVIFIAHSAGDAVAPRRAASRDRRRGGANGAPQHVACTTAVTAASILVLFPNGATRL